jgi:MYXO-CTERM domain-containing protein
MMWINKGRSVSFAFIPVFVALIAATAPSAHATGITLSGVGLFNTGQNADGSLAAGNAADPNYTSASGTVYVLPNPNGAWVAPGPDAQYVAPDTSNGGAYGGGVYTLDYDTSFDLTGYDPDSVVITGQWATDNYGNDIIVNGITSGDTSPDFTALTAFTLSGNFIAGINTIDFNWANVGGPGALLVEFTSITGASTPEPATLLIGAFGLGLIPFLRRRAS